MRALLQRARDAQVRVDGEAHGGFTGAGLVVFVGVTHADDRETAARLAAKAYQLRVFTAEGDSTELSAQELSLPLLVISQFTLYADTTKGRRPSWKSAATGRQAEPLVAAFAAELERLGADVSTGVFGADMQVSLTNDGPFTILLELDPPQQR